MADLLSHHKDESQRRFRVRVGGSLVTVFFYLSLGVFLVLLAGYGGLVLLNRAQEGVESELRAQIKEKEEEASSEALDRIFIFDRQLSDLKSILSGHIFASNAFAFVEETVHPEVRFSSFNFAAASLKVDMQASAASYLAVSQQIGIFKRSAPVQSVTFGGLSLDKDKVSFNVSLVFAPELLRFKQ